MPTAGFASTPQVQTTADVDVLAPEGISLGMTLAEAESALLSLGYSKAAPCGYRKGQNGALLVTSTANDCVESDPIVGIDFTFSQLGGDASMADVLAAVERRIGAPMDGCMVEAPGQVQACRWDSPPEATGAGKVTLTLMDRGRMGMYLKVVLAAPPQNF